MWADPACTILFSVIVFCTTLTIAKDTVHILIEGYPKVSIRFEINNISYNYKFKSFIHMQTNYVIERWTYAHATVHDCI